MVKAVFTMGIWVRFWVLEGLPWIFRFLPMVVVLGPSLLNSFEYKRDLLFYVVLGGFYVGKSLGCFTCSRILALSFLVLE